METKNIEIKLINEDLSKILSDLRKHLSYLPIRGDDVEFKRLWDIFNKSREKLIEIDKDIFSKLRNLPCPEPDKSSYIYSDWGGKYSTEHIIPLLNETEIALRYLKVFLNSSSPPPRDDLLMIKNIARRFHAVSRQLRDRSRGREALQINDEYDVQYLLNALLKLYYDDIRPEEWTPSYAGSSSRMDFLLKSEQIVIEVKKTRASLTSKVLGEQLIIDIEKYTSHPDCKTLFCFAYDPEGFISNPAAIENDLSKVHNDLNIVVIIEPK